MADAAAAAASLVKGFFLMACGGGGSATCRPLGSVWHELRRLRRASWGRCGTEVDGMEWERELLAPEQRSSSSSSHSCSSLTGGHSSATPPDPPRSSRPRNSPSTAANECCRMSRWDGGRGRGARGGWLGPPLPAPPVPSLAGAEDAGVGAAGAGVAAEEPRSLASRGLCGDEAGDLRPELGEGLEGGGGSLGSSERGGNGEVLGEVEFVGGGWVGPAGGGGPGGRGGAPGGAADTAARSTISLATPFSPTGAGRPHPSRATLCTTLAAARRPRRALAALAHRPSRP